ncbi:MAG: VOC family protein [Steroidobacteraceae bacterium]
MAAFKVLGINHTSFTVRSLDKAIAFYCDGLGFKLKSRAPRDASATPFVVGVAGAAVHEVAHIETISGHILEFVAYSGPADRGQTTVRPCDSGATHIALDVDNIEEATALAIQHYFTPLSAKPVAHRTGGPNAGSIIQFLRHEDGYFLELIQRGGLSEDRSRYLG